MTKKFYAIGNSYKTVTSNGFANTEFVRIFDTKAERDEWVNTSEQAVRACTKKEAIDAMVGNQAVVGSSCTRKEAWQFILLYNNVQRLRAKNLLWSI